MEKTPEKIDRSTWSGLGMLLLVRIVLQLALLRAGFLALTADEFARMLLAARWSQGPFVTWQGVWLPFHMYLYGAALWLFEDIWLTGRVVTAFLGLLSLLLMFLLVWRLSGSQRAALISVVLLGVNPLHLWLSSTPLTETAYLNFLLASAVGLVLFWQQDQRRYLFLAAAALLLASGFRYEAWLAAAVFSGALLLKAVQAYRFRELSRSRAAWLLGAAALPWVFPVLWMAGNAAANGDPLYFLQTAGAYKRTWYGAGQNYQAYVQAFLKIDPWVLLLAGPGLALMLARRQRTWSVGWYAALAIVPLLFFIFLHGGQPEPPANYLRYLAGFVFLLVPAAAFLLDRLAKRLSGQSQRQSLILLLILGLIVTLQLRTAFQFKNDAAAAGLAVGRQIQQFQQQGDRQQRSVVIELLYWDYLAIRTGANEPRGLLYDRQLDPDSRRQVSLLSSDPPLFIDCLHTQGVGLVVVKSLYLRQFLEGTWGWVPDQESNGYAFYALQQGWLPVNGADQPLESTICPLEYSYPD